MLQLFCYSYPHPYIQHCVMWESLFESSKTEPKETPYMLRVILV